MNEVASVCTSSGINRTFLSRAISFRLSRQPSSVYPVAVILPSPSWPPVALSPREAQATRNIEATTASTMKKRFMTPSIHREAPAGLHITMDFKERHAGRLLRVLIVASKGLRSKTAEFAGLSEKDRKS